MHSKKERKKTTKEKNTKKEKTLTQTMDEAIFLLSSLSPGNKHHHGIH
jgi:hypothetical protein